MEIKESLLLYFRDINYAYNDSTRLDALEKGLAKLEEVVRCKDCKWSYTDEETLVCGYRGFFVNEAFFCADGERKDDA